MTIQLTPDQERVRDFVIARVRAKEPLTTIGGLAGTGKSFLTAHIAKLLRDENPKMTIAFCCFTGKAKSVLEAKLKAADALRPGDFCGTLHSFLYRPITAYTHNEEERTIEKIVTFDSKDRERYDLVVIDEASMVTEDIFCDLEGEGIPILAVGDHGQLPPVMGNFSLMAEPMMRLERIHRQAENNPIIRLAHIARETGHIAFGEYGLTADSYCLKTRDGAILSKFQAPGDWTLICGTNAKRVRLNAWMRHRLMGSNAPDPVKGDRLICLQNNHMAGIHNGMLGVLLSSCMSERHWLAVEIDMGEFVYHGRIFRWQFGKDKTLKKTVQEAPEVHPDDFGDLFDYGYCLTTWKAQGSEADNVVFYEEERVKNFMRGENWNRFLYTAITRAKNNLVIIGE